MNFHKTKKYCCSILTVILALVLTISPVAMTVSATGTPDTVFALGESTTVEETTATEATAENIDISTEEELRALAERVNAGESLEGVTITLKNDIAITSSSPWVPIGDKPETPFSGEFNGQGYSINSFFVAKDIKGGLFGFLDKAHITRLTIGSFFAPESSGGLFFIAASSTIDLSRSGEGAQSRLFSMSPMTVGQPWNGTSSNVTWAANYLTEDTFEINDPEQLEGLRILVASGSDFAGKTIYITQELDMGNQSWTSIGSLADTFSGTLIGVGTSGIISNLKVENANSGLFEDTFNATFSNLTLYKADMSTTGSVGGLVNVATNTNFNRITIKECTITSTNASGLAAGIVNKWISIDGRSISQCLVINSHIQAPNGAAGIVIDNYDVSISNCVVYGGTIKSPLDAAGIYLDGMNGGLSYSTVTNCLVVGVDFTGSGLVSAIGTSSSQYFTTSNCFVTNVTIPTGTVGVNVLATPNGGVQYLVTDSTDPIVPLVDSTPDNLTTNNFWDNISQIADVATNKGYDTAYMTNGTWAPSLASWATSAGHYPQIKTLKESTFNDISLISDVAAIAITPADETENYLTGVKQLHLPVKTAGGTRIIWTGYDTNPAIKDISAELGITDSIVLTTYDTNNVTGLNLVANVGSYKKTFSQITLLDSQLLITNTTPANNAPNLDADAVEIKITFGDPVEINPNLADLITLSEVYSGTIGTTQVVPGTALVGGAPNTGFVFDDFQGADPYSVKLVFTPTGVRAGVDYLLTLPEGMVKEKNKTNLSPLTTITFSTAVEGAPQITLASPVFKWPNTAALSWNDLLPNFTVHEKVGGTVMFDFANGVGLGTTTEYTGSGWDDSNALQSMDLVLANMAPGTVHYKLSDDSILTGLPDTDEYQLYIMAKNIKGKTSKSILIVSIQGAPEWIGIPPRDHVHIPWTKNLEAVKAAGKQGAIASIPQASSGAIAVPVDIIIPDAEWQKVLDSDTAKPMELHATLFALDQGGNMSIPTPITIYLDTPLHWTTTPSPITMAQTTERQVEEKINIIARNFNRDTVEVEFDHWYNNYRKPGEYIVDITSAPQYVTVCKGNCTDPQNHPKDRVEDYVVLNLIDKPGADIDSSWGHATASLEGEGADIYSRSVTIKPGSFRLPAYVPEALAEQEYGHAIVAYPEYRWNFYSNTLNHIYRWNEYYDLEVNPVQSDTITTLLGNQANSAIQLEFNHVGRLFGTTKFDVNIAGLNISQNELGLYRYNHMINKLELISDVIVEDGMWATALLDEIYPTVYVLKTKNPGDILVLPSEENFREFYISTKNINEKTGIIEDKDPFLVTKPLPWKELINIITGEVSVEGTPDSLAQGVMPVSETSGKTVTIVAIVGASVVLAAAGTVIFLRKRKEEN